MIKRRKFKVDYSLRNRDGWEILRSEGKGSDGRGAGRVNDRGSRAIHDVRNACTDNKIVPRWVPNGLLPSRRGGRHSGAKETLDWSRARKLGREGRMD